MQWSGMPSMRLGARACERQREIGKQVSSQHRAIIFTMTAICNPSAADLVRPMSVTLNWFVTSWTSHWGGMLRRLKIGSSR